PLNFKVRFVGEVYGHSIAQEPVEFKDVHGELTIVIPRFVGKHEVHVIVEVAPRFAGGGGSSARQSQVDAVDDVFGAAIEATVDVEHPGDSLVHVLRREAEHVIVEPVGAHGLVPVTGDLVKTAGVRGTRRHNVRGSRVDGVTTGQDDRIVIIVELV